MTDDGLGLDDLNDAITGEGDEGSSNGNGGGGGRRKTIIIKSVYGSEQVPPDTSCEECNKRAIGVLVKKKKMGSGIHKTAEPLCSIHRDSLKRDIGDVWEEYDFRRFVDQ